MNVNARCEEDASHTSARGAQHAPERAPVSYTGQPVVASYDPATGRLTWSDPSATGDGALSPTGTVAPPTLGEESWKWLFLQPLTAGQE
jgi:phospholipid/cholesterol/gamma-HCH transport system substrate-binding protein